MNILLVDDNPIFRKTYRLDPWYYSSKGHSVTVICPKPIRIKRSLSKDPNVNFIFTYPFTTIKKSRDIFNKFLHIFFNIIRIRALIKNGNYDLIRAVGFISAYSSLVARGNIDIPVVSNLTDFYSNSYKYLLLPFSSVAQKILRMMEKKIVVNSNLLFVDTPTMRRYWTYWGLDEKKCVILPNGYDGNMFHPNIDSSTIRDEYGIDETTKILVYSGDISHMDGLDILIEAIKKITTFKVKLLILGGGPKKYLDDLFRKVKENNLENKIIFVGWKPYESVPLFLAAADICLAPFRINLTSNSTECLKIVEYLAMHKNIISSKADGLMELFGDTLNYVPPEDPQALADMIITVIQTPKNNKVKDNMDKIIKKLTWKNVWINEEKIFRIMLEKTINDYRIYDTF